MTESPKSSYPDLLLRLLPANANIIVEIGCGTGTMGEHYKRINPRCQYFGVEANAEAAAIAATRIDGVAIAFADLPILLGEVDCLVYGNVLSDELGNVADLENCFRQHSQWLKDDGQVLAYMPNPQYWLRISKFIRGVWDSEPEFIAAPNQIYFATVEMIRKMFTVAGLYIYEIQTDYPQFSAEQSQQFEKFQTLIAPLVEYLGLQSDRFQKIARAQAFLVRATKSPIKSRLFIQTFIAAAAGCARIRVYEPSNFTSTIPGTRNINILRNQPIDMGMAMPEEEKVFIWQRALLLYPQDIKRQQALLQRDFLIVAEHDDDPYYWPENADNKFFLFISSHCIQTSTERLAKHLKQFNPNVKAFENQLAYLPPKRQYADRDPVQLFFGALNRQNDWQPLMPALNRILRKHKHVVAQVIHDREFFDALDTDQKQFQPFCPYEEYQATLHTCDIGILPLGDTQFNRMKSDLKFLEYAGHGVAALASPVVYADTILAGETGLIYNSPDDFAEKLEELIINADLRQQLADRAYKWVAETRLMSQHYQARREWYLEMRSQLPRLNAELRDRCPEMFG
jgi:glycosyltransferase involved in cell wall biosynthesis/SAM-dependent methyltransferase